ncbi:MAG: DNA polymerase III subunit delta' [Alphaproteobacteria bacterium GWF2_58_20]|nr:MAG: DNA polymerase III subunit delta' [Alphaproteobacteria bacterium GWF2_58_20]
MTAPEARANPFLVGHEEAERGLLAAFYSGRLPHAWVFAGPPGIGKATLAFRFARFLLSQGGMQNEGNLLFAGEPVAADSLYVPETSPVFSRMAASGHADLCSISRPFDEKTGRFKEEIPVDEVRRIPPFLRMTSAEGGYRVVVVDGADGMNRSGQNAILKILEEPPEKAVLVLTASNPGALLPTIRSRSRSLMLSPLPEETVAELMARYGAPDMPEEERKALSRMAEGSIGRALALADEGGLSLYKDMIDLMIPLPNLDILAVNALADRLARPGSGAAFGTVSGFLIWWLMRLARFGARGEVPPEVVPGEGSLAQRLVAQHGLDWTVEVWEKVRNLFEECDRANLDKRQAFVSAFLALR